MGKYTITYECGCQEVMNLFGKITERERTIARYATMACPHCRALAAQKEAEAAGLPLLKGSDKQISWASDIRKEAIELIDKMREIATDKDLAESLFKPFLANTSASFWIENRAEITTSQRSLLTFLVANTKK